jgi:hemerythrin
MPIIEWNDSLMLGIQPFDEHHQHLVGLINKVYDDFTTGAPAESIGIVLDELVDYAKYHFAAEECWMKVQLYPKLVEHCDEHDRFSSRVVEMLEDYHDGKLHLSIEVLTFLKNWLKNHILQTDAEYGRYIAAKGVPIDLI